jgi:hypothetical protein
MSSVCASPARSFFRPALAAALLAAAAAGCGRYGDVSGKVTYKGKPLVWGTIQFEGSDGRLRQANIGRDGSYSVSRVTTGEVKIAVSSNNPKSGDFQARPAPGKKPKPPPDVPGWFPIPQKYDTTFRSGLTHTVKSGQNTFDIDLQ